VWQGGIDQMKTKSFSVSKYGEAQGDGHQTLMEETLPHYILAYGHV